MDIILLKTARRGLNTGVVETDIDLGRDAHYGRGAAHVINSMLQAQNQQSKPQRLPDISPHIQVYVSSYFHLPATYLPFCCHCWIDLRREHECR